MGQRAQGICAEAIRREGFVGLLLPAEGFALEDEVAFLSLWGGLGKGFWGLGGEAFLEGTVFLLFGQVVPLVGILLEVVEFLAAVLVANVSPLLVHDGVGLGEHVRQVDVSVLGLGGLGEGLGHGDALQFVRGFR